MYVIGTIQASLCRSQQKKCWMHTYRYTRWERWVQFIGKCVL